MIARLAGSLLSPNSLPGCLGPSSKASCFETLYIRCTALLKEKKKPAYLLSIRAHGDESLRLLETVQRAITLKEINLASRQSRPVSDLIRCPKNVFVTHGWRKKAKLRLFCAKSERLQKGHTSFLRANHAAG